MVARASLTITASTFSRVYDTGTSAGAAPTVTGLQSSDSVTGLAEAFTSKNVAGMDGSTLVVTAFTIQDGNGGQNYTVTIQSATGTITPAPLTVSATGLNKTYDASTGATVLLADNHLGTDSVTSSYASAAFSDKNAATGKTVSVSGISISGPDAGNYSLQNTTATTTADITPAVLTVSGSGANKVYDAGTGAIVLLADNHLGTDSVTDSLTSAAFSDRNVSTGKPILVSGISISGPDAGNYALQNTTATTTADITPALLTVSASGVNKVYDASTGATVLLTDNHLGTDSVTGSYTNAAFADKNVGTGKPVIVRGISLSGPDAANYALQNTTATTTANITPALLTVTAITASKLFGTSNPSFTYTLTGFAGGDGSSAVSGSPSLVTSATQSSPEGAYAITAGFGTLVAANYQLQLVNSILYVTSRCHSG